MWSSLIFNLYTEWKWNAKSKNKLSYSTRIPVKPITIERKHTSPDQIDFSFCSPMCCKTQATSRAPFRLRDSSALKNKCWVCPWTALSLQLRTFLLRLDSCILEAMVLTPFSAPTLRLPVHQCMMFDDGGCVCMLGDQVYRTKRTTLRATKSSLLVLGVQATSLVTTVSSLFWSLAILLCEWRAGVHTLSHLKDHCES